MISVLHATEALGAGVETAIEQYARALPEVAHYLVASPRRDHGTAGALDAAMVRSWLVEPGLPGLAREMRRVVRSLRPDVVHLHAPLAGGAGRLVLPRGTRIVYSPHCFPFDRVDLPPGARPITRAIERLLALRTDLLCAVSPHEVTQARALGMDSVLLPHACAVAARERRPGTARALRLVAVGRIVPQKDPRFFAAVLRALDPHLTVQTTWVGDGDATLRRALTDAGVDVTGWLPRETALDRLADADLFVHTAAWEGAPLSVLEAAMIGLPLVVRAVPSTVSLGFDPALRTPAQVAAAIARFAATGATPVGPATPDPVLARAELRLALSRAYGVTRCTVDDDLGQRPAVPSGRPRS